MKLPVTFAIVAAAATAFALPAAAEGREHWRRPAAVYRYGYSPAPYSYGYSCDPYSDNCPAAYVAPPIYPAPVYRGRFYRDDAWERYHGERGRRDRGWDHRH